MNSTSTDQFVELRELGISVDTDARRLSEYSYDASNYRVPPIAVVFPRSVDEVVAVVQFSRRQGIPLTSRGGGTSMAGNALGRGIIVDFSRHMNSVRSVDVPGMTATVEVGVVLSRLRGHVEERSEGTVTFAPDPSSQNRATIGGAIGNDACGNHSVRYGRMSDHVVSLDLVTAEGLRLTASENDLRATVEGDALAAQGAAILKSQLRQLRQRNGRVIREELDRIPRQVSGYHLSHLLPESGFNVARALVGSEGTCVLVVGAQVRLVPKPPAALLLILGYRDVVDAARDVPTLLEYSPAAIEGIDEAIVDTVRWRRGAEAISALPEGKAWLYIDLDGDSPEQVQQLADEVLARLRENGRVLDGRKVLQPEERASLWRVREDGAGLSARLRSGEESWPGWEDSAVAPDRLADYLSDFRELMAEYSLSGVMYGHFGAGCMHIRLTFDLRTSEGVAVMERFTHEAAELVVRHGGSLSGEHGDGRARSELLPVMYSPGMMNAFVEYKQLWDPEGLLNPGSITAPAKIIDDLALADVPEREWRTSLDLRVHGAEHSATAVDPFTHAVQACVGIGRCRSHTGGVMCPSYRATGDEKDSTRGRSRVLQEMVRGATSVEQGWRSEEVRDALDLCLSCKACSSDCPVGVDMASYKSEFFDHYYEGRLRPIAHYSLGWLPLWLRFIGLVAPLVNIVLSTPIGPVIARLGGVTTKRKLPKFARRGAWKSHMANRPENSVNSREADVVLFVDTFTRGFRPQVAGAAERVLGSAGKTVECSSDACCGLTWISTGQLKTASKLLAQAAEKLDDGSDRPIVVLEPSCAAALRKDLPELVHNDAAKRVSARIRSFADMVVELAGSGWSPPWGPEGAPDSVTVQAHCHEYSVFGARVQQRALSAVGVENVTEATGCCGVAGNFGFEAQHYELSMTVSEQALQPALAATDQATPVLTDGFSCQMQVVQLDQDRKPMHLAELIASRMITTSPDSTNS